MKKIVKTLAAILAVVMLLALTSCVSAPKASGADKDREGNPITLPETIGSIISLGPSNTEIITALGLADKIIAADTYSVGIPELPEGIPLFDMLALDKERLIELDPDIIIITGMTKVGGINPLELVEDAGICVAYVPFSNSIDSIKEDIMFIAGILRKEDAGTDLVSAMEKEISDIAEIGAGITDKKTVYFEIEAAPYMYSFGSGVFLNEMIEIIGAENIFGDLEGWAPISEEAILDRNPDIILTNVGYLDDPVGDILDRLGWDAITAVKNDGVFYIDADSSSRPTQNIIKALKEMIKAVYPEEF